MQTACSTNRLQPSVAVVGTVVIVFAPALQGGQLLQA